MTSYFDNTDLHQPNASRTFVVTESMFIPDAGTGFPSMPSASWALANYLKAEFPELERVARASLGEEVAVTTDGSKAFMQVSYADGDFLRVFDLPFISGDKRTALDGARRAVVTRDLALRLFGSDRVVGRHMLVSNRESVTITGVIDRLPAPSHMSTTQRTASLYFEALVSMDTHVALREATYPKGLVETRYERLTGGAQFYTYALFPKNSAFTLAEFNRRLKSFAERNDPKNGIRVEFEARPLPYIVKLGLDMFAGTSKTGISSSALLLLLGVTVLVLSCLNYANLAAAQADARTKEIAVRRVVGAGRTQIVVQHIAEAILLTSFALVLALGIVGFLMLTSSPLLRSVLSLALLHAPAFASLMLGVLVGVSLLASSYPSLILARVRPALGLASKRPHAGSKKAATALVCAQFGAASLLLIMLIVMRHQNDMARRAGAGSADTIVVIANDLNAIGVNPELLRTELARQPHVRGAASTMVAPWSMNGNSYGGLMRTAEVGAPQIPVVSQLVGEHYFESLDYKFLAGRTLSKDFAADVLQLDSRPHNIIVDLSLARQLGFANAEAAIGKVAFQPSGRARTPPIPVRIVGVVADKPMTLLGFGATSSTFELAPQVASIPLVRVSSADAGAALREIDAVWSQLVPNVALQRRFLNEQFERNYEVFQWLTDAFTSLTLFAFLIAGMGLIGMAIHVASRRTHEIAVRKTLGATVMQVLSLLLVDFSRPIVIANLIVWPVAFVGARAYLNVFANRTDLTLWPFLLSLGLVLLIAWAAVIGQVTRAARLNPATVLRYE